ncbi:MAG: hypothetical protein AAFW70_22250 [Cyanobacteria bacterium J06635_10]
MNSFIYRGFRTLIFLSDQNFSVAIQTPICHNNTEPVPPSERVYPQHLIGVAIDFLEAAGIDWDEVKNVEELREQLKI